jgi:hypothetical protein
MKIRDFRLQYGFDILNLTPVRVSASGQCSCSTVPATRFQHGIEGTAGRTHNAGHGGYFFCRRVSRKVTADFSRPEIWWPEIWWSEIWWSEIW